MPRHFEIASRFGFKYLEFGIGGGQTGRLPEQPTDEEIKQFRSLATQYDIQTPFCCIENDFTLADHQDHQRMVEKVLSQIRTASDCGATHVRLFAGFTPLDEMTDERWQRMIKAFELCDSLCQELDLLIAIETHGALRENEEGSVSHTHTVTTQRQGLERLLRELPRRVGINYDPGNIKAADPDNAGLHLDLLNSRINYCHLKDWHRKGSGWQACAIGDDDLDYRPIFEAMLFDGVYLIEYEPLDDPEDGIRRSLNYLRKIVPEVSLEERSSQST